jgi:hypothetical protein
MALDRRPGIQCCKDVSVWSPAPFLQPPNPSAINEVAEFLDPVLTPLGFALGQGGAFDLEGQVIFCRGDVDSTDGGCVDLVIDLGAKPVWRITDVRYWGFPSDRWHLDFDSDASLSEQLAKLARTLPTILA